MADPIWRTNFSKYSNLHKKWARGVFGVADSESDEGFVIFKIADPKWQKDSRRQNTILLSDRVDILHGLLFRQTQSPAQKIGQELGILVI